MGSFHFTRLVPRFRYFWYKLNHKTVGSSKSYLLSDSISVMLIVRLRDEEEDSDGNATLGSPGGHPHYVVGAGLLRVVIGPDYHF